MIYTVIPVATSSAGAAVAQNFVVVLFKNIRPAALLIVRSTAFIRLNDSFPALPAIDHNCSNRTDNEPDKWTIRDPGSDKKSYQCKKNKDNSLNNTFFHFQTILCAVARLVIMLRTHSQAEASALFEM